MVSSPPSSTVKGTSLFLLVFSSHLLLLPPFSSSLLDEIQPHGFESKEKKFERAAPPARVGRKQRKQKGLEAAAKFQTSKMVDYILEVSNPMKQHFEVTAFIGGIDLCDGRYDTPDLETVFKDDFHNPTFPAGTKDPKQPWHDLH
ncbi:unnamed protein product [Arabidopsis lyrata]|nr:unnamed protein product [Arabidopsis lyrata]